MALDDKERTKAQLTAWAKAVDVQQHFNDLELRTRTLCLTLLGTIFGAVAYTQNLLHNPYVPVFSLRVPLSTILLLLAGAVVLLFWFMDNGWYHQFLRGAVSTGQRLEHELKQLVPELDLTLSISRSSHQYVFDRMLTSGARANIFYGLPALAAYLLAIISVRSVAGLAVAIVATLLTAGLFFTRMPTKPVVTSQKCAHCDAAVTEKLECSDCGRPASVPSCISAPRRFFRAVNLILFVVSAVLSIEATRALALPR